MNDKVICLISRSTYPLPMKSHTQNMHTFEGWSRFWDTVLVISQCHEKKIQINHHKKIYGVFMPLKSNRYLNVIYFTFIGIFQIKKLFKKHEIDIFQASDAGGAALAFIMSRVYGKKFIFEVQGDIFNYPGKVGGRIHSSIVKFFSKVLVKHADYIRIVSPFLYEPLDALNINSNKIFLIPPRCDSVLFSKNNHYPVKPEIFEKNKINLLFVGNLLIAKGVDILLEAFALIQKENSDIGLIFVGDGLEKENLIKRSKEMGVKDKVIFTGRIEYQKIPLFMNYSDILILPSIEEGVGRVILEAMSMKLPVIASNVGGIPLVIDDKENGLLFEVGDIDAIKNHVMLLVKNKVFADNLTLSAYKKFKINYDYEVSINMFLDMYKHIVD
jgi:L-malate glycosyltransferase